MPKNISWKKQKKKGKKNFRRNLFNASDERKSNNETIKQKNPFAQFTHRDINFTNPGEIRNQFTLKKNKKLEKNFN